MVNSQTQDEWLKDYHLPIDDLIDGISSAKSITDLSKLVSKLSKASEPDKPYLRLIFNKKRKANNV